MTMESMRIVSAIVAIWAFTFAESALQHTAPAPGVDCSSLVLNMADCLTFVTQGSTVIKPEGTCCSGLKMVLKTDAECLCEGFKNSAQLGVTLNVSKAMTLPAACHVSAPSIGDCGLAADTGAAPALAPVAGVSPSSNAVAPTTVNGATVLTPALSPESSGSSVVAVSVLTLVLTAVAACFSM